jgi:pimeloyl-ACP methyl ester carboxylesterase
LKHIAYIHGLASSGKMFNFINAQLPEHDVTFADYDSSQSIESSYEQVLSKLPRDIPITLVGHSLGGIIGHMLSTRDNGCSIEQLITISAPFGGSDTAGKLKWFYPSYRIFKDLSPRSKILEEVAKTPVQRCPFTSLISISGHLPFVSEINDGVVSLESQRLSKAKKKIEIKANHFEILQDEVTIKELKKLAFRINK